MIDLIKLLRVELRQFAAYESARSLITNGSVFLDANESFESGIPDSSLNRYPDPQPQKLLERFAKYYQVDPRNLMIGRGSDEAIDLLVRTFCDSGKDAIIQSSPTYGMYKVSSNLQGAEVLDAPLKLNNNLFSLDVDRIAETRKIKSTKLIFVCSPNNPTGGVFSEEDILNLVKLAEGNSLIVVDEAYAEFSGKSMIKYVNQFSNLIVLRTLSKAWGLAGLRLGVAIANPQIISLLNKVRAPYPVPTPCLELALEAMSAEGEEKMNRRVDWVNEEKNRIVGELGHKSEINFVYPSDANFILFKVENADLLMRKLVSHGVILRNRSKDFGLNNCIRMTIGSTEENNSVLKLIE